MSIEDDLDVYLRARCTLIVLITVEEERAVAAVTGACGRLQRPCLGWDLAEGFAVLSGSSGAPSARDPIAALDQVEKLRGDTNLETIIAVNMINAMFEGTQQFEENDLQFLEELDEDSDDDIARAFSDAADFLESEECDVDGTVVLRLSISILALAAHNQGEEHKDTVIAPLEHLVEGV